MTTTTEVIEHEADLVVTERIEAADGVVALTLAAADGAALPAWTPGAHIDLELPGGLTRQYSLCGTPAQDGTWRIGVLRSPDSTGGSSYVHDSLHVGSTVRVRGPRNHFSLASAPRYIFIAGGIGITPMLPMLAQAAATGADWHLYYGGRSLGSMAFRDELAGHGARVTLVPQDSDGILDLATILGNPTPDTLVYCCGPEPLLAAVEEHCKAWPTGSLHLERFSAKEIADTGDDKAFEVVLQRSGKTIEVASDTTIFDAVRAAGVSVLGSCMKGVCGTCETEVIDGEVEHRDSVLSAEEQEDNEVMMICVSRARGDRLTLDL